MTTGWRDVGSRLAVVLAVVIPLSACRQTVVLDTETSLAGDASGSAGAGPDDDGGAGTNGIGMGGGNRDGGRDAPVGFCVGGQIQRLPISMRSPDITFSVDRSSSMQSFFGTGTRLQVVQQQIHALVSKYRFVKFGYQEFPASMSMCNGGQGCCAGDVTPPTYNNLRAIDKAIGSCDGNGPGCDQPQRPIVDALAKCNGALSSLFSSNEAGHRYVLLFTSGDPTCSGFDAMAPPCDGAVAQVTKLANAFVNTAVFGVGDSAAGSTCLDKLATFGGLADVTGPSPLYHLARTPTELSATFGSVVDLIAEQACKIDLRSSPAEPAKLQLLLDGIPVPNDAFDGWTFDDNNNVVLTVHGSYCHTLLLKTNQVDLLGGCPGPHN